MTQATIVLTHENFDTEDVSLLLSFVCDFICCFTKQLYRFFHKFTEKYIYHTSNLH